MKIEIEIEGDFFQDAEKAVWWRETGRSSIRILDHTGAPTCASAGLVTAAIKWLAEQNDPVKLHAKIAELTQKLEALAPPTDNCAEIRCEALAALVSVYVQTQTGAGADTRNELVVISVAGQKARISPEKARIFAHRILRACEGR